MPRVALLLLIALTTVVAHAGVRFDFTTEVTGYKYSGRMSIEDTRSRVDITEGAHPVFNPSHSIITRAGGKDILVLDHKNRTYFMRYSELIGGHLSTTRGIGRTTASKPRVSRTRVTGDRYVLNVAYRLSMDVEGEKLDGSVEMEAQFDLSPEIVQRALPWGLQFATKTGFPGIDRAIERWVPTRLPLRQVVSVSRRIADGPVVTETITTIASNVVSERIGDDEFHAPPGYRYQEPVFLFGSSGPVRGSPSSGRDWSECLEEQDKYGRCGTDS